MARLSRARPYHETEESLTQTSSPGNSPSDKENRHATASRPGDTNKRSQPRPMAPDVPDARNTSRMPPNKRQRLGDRSSNVQSDTQSSRHRPGNRYYDPNQNGSERRELRKGLRDLSRELHGTIPREIGVWHSSNQVQTPAMSIYRPVTMASAGPSNRRTATSNMLSRPPTRRLTRASSSTRPTCRTKKRCI
jgi:hypothetical protein